MTAEEIKRLEQLQEELRLCSNISAIDFMGMEKLEELLQLLIKSENQEN